MVRGFLIALLSLAAVSSSAYAAEKSPLEWLKDRGIQVAQATRQNGTRCEADSECSSSSCAPFMDGNSYCRESDRKCAHPGTIGVNTGERINHNGQSFCCEGQGWRAC